MLKKIIYTLVCAFLGALVAFSATFMIPKKWEAVAVLRVGSVAGIPIESPSEFVERLRSPATISEVVNRLEARHDIDGEDGLISSTRISTTGSSIQLRVRASKPETAIGIIDDYLEVVRGQQTNILEQQIEAVKRYGFLEKVSVVTLGEGKSAAEYRSKGIEALILTYPTQYTVKPAVLSKPVSPSRGLMVVLGFLLGAWIGGVVVYLKKK